MSIRIAGTGCSLLDVLYADIDFSSPSFKKYLSKKDGDGGLSPGKLVFTEEFEEFCGTSFPKALSDIVSGRPPAVKNLGGPSIVTLIHAAQILYDRDVTVDYCGARADDDYGRVIMDIIRKTPVRTKGYVLKPGVTPSTTVFSDPRYQDGHGERAFVNTIGTAWNYYARDVEESLFDADIAVFGGTGLVPRIHDDLTLLLKKAKARGAITIVNTVYDFRNEKRDPGGKWPLGESDETLQYTDLFIADYEEALKISGRNTIREAAQFYITGGVGAFIVTHGPEDIHIYSRGGLFAPLPLGTMPVSRRVGAELKAEVKPKGDTTGCGDNFAGGVVASTAAQLSRNGGKGLDLRAACAWGVVSGGFTAFYVGGTYLETKPGEKYERLLPYLKDYSRQIGESILMEI